MKFGLGLPVFALPGVADFRTPAVEQVDWQSIESVALDAENLGYDAVWVGDHLFLGVDDVIYECEAVMAALAAVTKRVRIGPIHFGMGFRSPAVVATSLATIDQISGGRLEFFADAGWRRREFDAFGLPWIEDLGDRVAALEEAIEIVVDIWAGDRPQRQGRFHRVSGAPASPPPAQTPRPRLWLGEAMDDASLRLIAERADVWNSIPASPVLLRRKLAAVDEACRQHGRDPDTLVRSLETQVLIVDQQSEIEGWWEANDRRFEAHRDRLDPRMEDVVAFIRTIDPEVTWPPSRESVEDNFVMGTVDEVIDRFREYRDLGISEVICWFMDIPDRRSMRLLAERVAPAL